MTGKDAADLIALLEQNGLEVYVDGGWAVDAVLGEQTRPHDDLDIALPHAQVPRLRALLITQGFREQHRDDSWECNFVLADEIGRRLDVHSYTLDAASLNAGGVAYSGEQLTGRGVIGGYPVRCISPQWLVKFHTGYELDHKDWHDVRLLCERFQIAVPDEVLEIPQVGLLSRAVVSPREIVTLIGGTTPSSLISRTAARGRPTAGKAVRRRTQ